MKKFTLIIILLIKNSLIAQSEKLSRFYDFGIEIDYSHSLQDDDYKIIFPNGFNYGNLNKNSLYKIRYSYDENKNRIPIDTLKIELEKKEIDRMFVLTKKQFDIKYGENLSKSMKPPAPYLYDDLVVSLTFELKFWDDKYIKEIGIPFKNETFNKLNDYIELLIKKHTTE
ncbi:hypothetical protein [Psychroflexus sp. ALD_RP9]|uniref:hypothetical protein n=1 Tax=Psychroflexus sp. ALD_RP9 TaxID=2777186 RepID=UPI001A8F832C|nr:hypothetical protein [Psychroflexus sp. ALD_RP9]QSS96637.1 hypothetical protein IMZ30_09310 [Psychroflexus sp. ALD_RP9]